MPREQKEGLKLLKRNAWHIFNISTKRKDTSPSKYKIMFIIAVAIIGAVFILAAILLQKGKSNK